MMQPAHHAYISPEHVTGCEKELATLLCSNAPSVFLLTGASGIGKTTTLYALLGRSDLQKHFKEGVYMVGLGTKATPEEVCDSLVDILEGLRLRRTLARVQPMLQKPQSRMEGISTLISNIALRSILLLFDDVDADVESGTCVGRAVRTLSNVKESKLRIVTATVGAASANTFPMAKRITVDPTVEDREQMVCKHAEIAKENICESGQMRTAFHRVIDKCDGLPLHLMLAGRAIRELKMDETLPADQVWERYLKELSRVAGPGARHCAATGWLRAAVRLNTELIEHNVQHTSTADLFRAMCVLPRARRVPLTTLSCLWGLDILDAEKVAMMFVRLGVLSIERTNGMWICMHEMVHDACWEDASKQGELFVKNVHGSLVDSYYKLLDIMPDGESERHWWAPMRDCDEEEDDGYLTDNLVRHLSGCGRVKETLSVLADYLWTEIRVVRSRSGRSLHGLTQDVGDFLSSLPSFTAVDYCATRESIEEIREGLNFLSDAARRAGPFVAENPAELAFQLYGRLAHRRERSPVVKRFLWSVDRRAEALRRQEKDLVEV